MASKKEPNIVAIDCSDSENDTKKGLKIRPRLKKDYLKKNKDVNEMSKQFSEEFNERSQE
jgi:hypothetical protein